MWDDWSNNLCSLKLNGDQKGKSGDLAIKGVDILTSSKLALEFNLWFQWHSLNFTTDANIIIIIITINIIITIAGNEDERVGCVARGSSKMKWLWNAATFVALIVYTFCCPDRLHICQFFALLIHINAHFADLTNNAERTGFVYRLV